MGLCPRRWAAVFAAKRGATGHRSWVWGWPWWWWWWWWWWWRRQCWWSSGKYVLWLKSWKRAPPCYRLFHLAESWPNSCQLTAVPTVDVKHHAHLTQLSRSRLPKFASFRCPRTTKVRRVSIFGWGNVRQTAVYKELSKKNGEIFHSGPTLNPS